MARFSFEKNSPLMARFSFEKKRALYLKAWPLKPVKNSYKLDNVIGSMIQLRFFDIEFSVIQKMNPPA